MKKKLLGMLLAGTLMVGAVGSYAWFSDQEKVNSGIKLTMGTLDVKVIDENNGWEIQNKEESEIINKDNKKNFKNVRPGDVFQREFLVQNVGTLKQKVTVKLNSDLADIDLGHGKKFSDLFKLTLSSDFSPLEVVEHGSEANFELDSIENSVETEDEYGNIGYSDTRKVIVKLEVKPEMGNAFNALGSEYKEIINLRDYKGEKIKLLTVDAQQINYVEDQN